MATQDDLRTSDLSHFGRRLDLTGEERVGQGPLAGASAVLVIEGLVSLETVLGEVRAAQVLGPRDVVALDGDHLPDHFEMLVALLPSRLYVFDEGLDALVVHRPSIGGELLRASMERHRRQAVHRAVVQLPALEHRVLGVLWMLADRFGRVAPEGVVIDLPLTHKLLGRLAGATRSAVTTAFGKLERDGHVQRRDDGSLVIDPASRQVPGLRGGRERSGA